MDMAATDAAIIDRAATMQATLEVSQGLHDLFLLLGVH